MFQKLEFIGYLGRDPEQRFLPSGDPVTNFSVASNRTYTDGEGKQVEITTWFNVSVYGKRGDACHRFLKKGSQVFVEGWLVPDPQTGGPRVWTNKEGKPASGFDVRGFNVQFLGKKDPFEAGEVPEEEDIPF